MVAENNSEKYKQTKYEHNKNMYEDLDKFISETPPTDNMREFQISGRDLRDGKKMYNEMKNAPYPDYEIFGANGGGYTPLLNKSKLARNCIL
jgi:hypothetical protein